MRKKIKEKETPFWGVNANDLDFTAKLTKDFFHTYYNSLVLAECKNETQELELYIEVHYRESQFALQFGIWRMQGLFESILKSKFKIVRPNGIAQILTAIKKQGFKIFCEKELLDWMRLRNTLSHSPPEILNPCPINLSPSDIDDYAILLKNVLHDLDNQLTKTHTLL